MRGRLQDRPLESLMRDLQARSSSGILTLTRAAVKKQICFVKGTVRFAASNLLEDRLAGQRDVNLDEVWSLLEESRFYARAILEGGIAVSDNDSVMDVRDFPSFLARSSCV